jgi:hypothetical protein
MFVQNMSKWPYPCACGGGEVQARLCVRGRTSDLPSHLRPGRNLTSPRSTSTSHYRLCIYSRLCYFSARDFSTKTLMYMNFCISQ